jgi:PilZ domain
MSYFRHMVETRAAPRYRVTKAAVIDHGGDKIKCAVRDLSITGASIEIFDATIVPEKFTLVVPEDKLKLSCRVVRRTEFRIGVAFD